MSQPQGQWGTQPGSAPSAPQSQQPFPQQQPYPQPYPQQPNIGLPPQGRITAAQPERRRLVGSPILLLMSPLLILVGMLLPWFTAFRSHSSDGASMGPRHDLNGLTVVLQATHNGFGGLAVLLLLAFLLAFLTAVVGAILGIVALATGVKGRGLGAVALVCAMIGLVGTLGVLFFYLATPSSASNHMGIGVWVYSLAMIPALIGSIGLLSKKF